MNPHEDESQRSEEFKTTTTTKMTTKMTTTTGKPKQNLNWFNFAVISFYGIRGDVSIHFRSLANRIKERGGGAIGIEEAGQLQQLRHCCVRSSKDRLKN